MNAPRSISVGGIDSKILANPHTSEQQQPMPDFILYPSTVNSDFAIIDTMSIEALNYITEETELDFESGGYLSIRSEEVTDFTKDAEKAHLHVDQPELGVTVR